MKDTGYVHPEMLRLNAELKLRNEIRRLEQQNDHLRQVIDGLVAEKVKDRVLDTEVKLELIKWFREWRKYRREMVDTSF